MSDPASGGEDFWSAVREANWQLPPDWELPAPVTPAVGLARRSLREVHAVPEGERDRLPLLFWGSTMFGGHWGFFGRAHMLSWHE